MRRFSLFLSMMVLLMAGGARAQPQVSQTQPAAAAPSNPPKTPGTETNHASDANRAPNPALAGPAPSPRARSKAEGHYLRGLRAMERGEARKAEREFDRAAREDPSNRQYAIDREIAREHGVTLLVQEAAKARIRGDSTAARQKLAEAMLLDPKNPEVTQHLDDMETLSTVAGGEDSFRIASPIELQPLAGKRDFHLRATEPEVLRRVLSAYGLDPTIDDTVALRTISFDAEGVDFAQAAHLLRMATDTFFVPLDPKRILIARDTKDNRTRYERLAVETLHLPGLTDAEITDIGNIARDELGIAYVTTDKSVSTLTVRAPHYRLAALNGVLDDLLQGRSEVVLQVRMYQVARTRMRNVGVQLPPTLTLFNVASQLRQIIQQNQSLVDEIISSGLANAGDDAAIVAILIGSGAVSNTVFNQPFALFGGGLTKTGINVPSVTANLKLNSSDTRVLDQIELRLEDKEEGTIRSGVRYPIVTSSYSNLAGSTINIPGLNSSGLSSSLTGLGVNLNNLSALQTIPQVQYQDLGLSLGVTPTIGRTGNVALKLVYKLTALEGTSLNGLPILSNTSYTADVVVGAGATAMLVSNLSRQETRAVAGLPGLSALPGFQSTTNKTSRLNESNLVIVIKPRLVRKRQSEFSSPMIPLPPHR